ncbi:MAG: hypothetical protein GX678_00440 [Actinomycetales bacterium]|nr:hypothetical protein [Actinomycetales bacterium]
MARLRRECAWTKEQTHESLRRYLIEEAYEAADALASGDADAMRDELGDVLMQVVFHAAIAESDGEGWDFDAVATTIADKLIRRTPHVFGDVRTDDPAQIDALWQGVKAQEREARPHAPAKLAPLPALLLAQKHLDLAGSLPSSDSLVGRLFALVAEAHEAGIDLELAAREELRSQNDKTQG